MLRLGILPDCITVTHAAAYLLEIRIFFYNLCHQAELGGSLRLKLLPLNIFGSYPSMSDRLVIAATLGVL